MYCPRCSQEQVSEQMRFCARCGFPLAIVSQLVANDGVIAGIDEEGKAQLSARQKGIRLGAVLMTVSGLLIPTVMFMTMLKPDLVFLFAPVLLVFLGGLIRLLYALRAKEESLKVRAAPITSAMPHRNAASRAGLPAHENVPPVQNWRQPITSEMIQPQSVTEQTTKLLDDE